MMRNNMSSNSAPGDAAKDPASNTPAQRKTPIASDKLAARFFAGMTLALGSLAIGYIGGWLFVGLVAVLLGVMLFEWTRMVEGKALGAAFRILTIFGVLALILAGLDRYALAFVATAVAGIGAALASRDGKASGLWAAVGAPYLIAPSIMLVWLRLDLEAGRAVVFLLFAIVWSADTAAYFMGRLIGGPKLSPLLSPAKTWAGAFGGVIAGGGVGFLAFSSGVAGLDAAPAVIAVAAGAFLGFVSILGDMAESACKRAFGVKDISGLIPGHGGFLDRLDGMIFVTAVAAAVVYGHIFVAGLSGSS